MPLQSGSEMEATRWSSRPRRPPIGSRTDESPFATTHKLLARECAGVRSSTQDTFRLTPGPSLTEAAMPVVWRLASVGASTSALGTDSLIMLGGTRDVNSEMVR